jgi:hypothetical protein
MEANADNMEITFDSNVEWYMFVLNFVIIGWVENYGSNSDDTVSHNTIFPTGWKVK